MEFTHSTIGTVGRAERSQLEQQQPETPPSQPQQEQQPLEQQPMRVADLRSLVELGCVEDSITLGGLTFSMRTMSDDEREVLFQKLSDEQMKGAADTFVELRRMVVAVAVIAVNGRSMESMSDGPGNALDRKVAIVRAMQSHVVDKLYDFYNGLLKRSTQGIEPEQAKN